jgi:hypothetical protein
MASTNSELYIKAQLIECAWKYGQHYGGTPAMLNILHTLKNREKAGFGTYLHVLDTVDKWHAAPPKTTQHPDAWDRRFLSLYNDIDGICDDTRKDSSNGALYWGDLADVQSEWWLTHVARNPERVRCADMGSLTFFK